MNTETSVATSPALKAALAAGPTSLETALGGVEIEVGNLDGTKETIKVRQLPVKDYKSALNALAIEVDFLALVCDRNPVWVEGLHPRSYTILALEAERQNVDFFDWSVRQTRRIEMLMPGHLANSVAAQTSGGGSSPSTRRPVGR